MQFNWVPLIRRIENYKRKQERWHRWFAWKIVKLYDCHDLEKPYKSRYAFLEIVYRRRGYRNLEFEYMSKQEYMKQKLKDPHFDERL